MIKFKYLFIFCVVFLSFFAGIFLQNRRVNRVKKSLIELNTQYSFLINENESLNRSILKLSHENSVLILKVDSLKSAITLKALNSNSRKIKIHF